MRVSARLLLVVGRHNPPRRVLTVSRPDRTSFNSICATSNCFPDDIGQEFARSIRYIKLCALSNSFELRKNVSVSEWSLRLHPCAALNNFHHVVPPTSRRGCALPRCSRIIEHFTPLRDHSAILLVQLGCRTEGPLVIIGTEAVKRRSDDRIDHRRRDTDDAAAGLLRQHLFPDQLGEMDEAFEILSRTTLGALYRFRNEASSSE
jgi:hypothetical protein